MAFIGHFRRLGYNAASLGRTLRAVAVPAAASLTQIKDACGNVSCHGNDICGGETGRYSDNECRRDHHAVTTKGHIIDSLGEPGLLLPARVNAALAANDRAKYLLTLLQTARLRAEHPARGAPDLRSERLACGVAEEFFDDIVGHAEALDAGVCAIAHAADIVERLLAEVGAMLEPLGAEATVLQQRLQHQRSTLGPVLGDRIAAAQIDRLASGDRDHGDSVHIVVMDAHKALNRLQAAIATEVVAGAHAYGIEAADRALIASFMQGVQRTAPLKFDHPGLGTTATRSGDRLVIQNDIGTTDAHVMVIHVSGLQVTLTYTDVHLQRLLFFQSLFAAWPVAWDDTRLRRDDEVEDGAYHLSIGRYTAPDAEALSTYLAFLGSRLVFLIDWNRARKRLRSFLPKAATIGVLRWAADHDVGHMAFLRAGGEQLIYDALEFALRGQVRVGQPLTELTGEAAAIEFMRSVLRTCTRALLAGEPESFIQDSVRAELLAQFRSGHQGLFDVASEHAAWIVELAAAVRDGVMQWRLPDAQSRIKGYATRAKAWESHADALVNRARQSERPGDASTFFRSLLEDADDIADELEDAVFHMTLLPSSASAHPAYAPLRELGNLVVQGAQEYLKAIETARHVRRGGAREDTSDFLEAIHRIMQVERRSDAAQRDVEVALAQGDGDFRALYMTAEAAKNLEQAADALMHCGLRMRDHVMRDMLAA
jgi:uncharacterized protein Yka (UPF0111/DUF47 family)